MLSSLLPILPSLGLLLIIVLGYFVFKQKVNEYNQKFTSMFSLLSAMTDEIQKLKKEKPFQQVEIDDTEVEDSEYETEEEYDDEYNNQEEDECNSQDTDNEEDDEEDEHDEPQEVDLEIELNDNEGSSQIQSADILEEVSAKEIQITENDVDYDRMTLKDLKALAKDRGLGNGDKLKKIELVNLLVDSSLKIE